MYNTSTKYASKYICQEKYFQVRKENTDCKFRHVLTLELQSSVESFLCLASMDIDLPVSTVTSLLKEQVDWEKKRQKASSKENLHQRYIFLGESANVDYVDTGTYKRRGKGQA